MKAPVLERTSAAKAGWLIILLTVGWLVFLLLPDPVEKKVTKSAVIPLPSSSLPQAGLRESPDWEGLPEIFAIWADHAGWKDDKAQFAYWNPGSHSYSYFFEATRKEGVIRFRLLSKTELDAAASIFEKEMDEWEKEGRPTEFESPEHPFVFFERAVAFRPRPYGNPLKEVHFPKDRPAVEVEMKATPVALPQSAFTNPAEKNDGQKK